MLDSLPRLLRACRLAPACWALACLLGAPGQAGAEKPPPPGPADTLPAALRRVGVDPAALARASVAADEPASPLAFPDRFRTDPVAGMAALHGFEMALQDSGGAAAVALRHALDLAHGQTRWPAMAPPATAPIAEHPRIEWPPDLPPDLRHGILAMLEAVAQAQSWRGKALDAWPSQVSAADLWRRFVPTETSTAAADTPTAMPTQTLVDAVDHRALALGMLQLTAAVDLLQRRLRACKPPAATWRFETPWGLVVIDTTRRHNLYRGRQPLLLIDTGGDDTYAFDEERPPGIAILLDLQGNDRYTALGPGRDPSSATLGYAVLWDAGGDDHYEGGWLTQGAALFGAAVLVDARGNDRYEAQGQAQGFALGGVAALIDRGGHDRYGALSQSQASAGPGGLALLLDMAGDDHYLLGNDPLVQPSAQLKDRNASLGQGTAYGLRPAAGQDAPTAPGGLALLVDGRGDDRYAAQVFAQGAGYERGMGVLLDGGGHDRMDAAWYAMGAAAHRGSGVLIARGGGRDSYTASHATSLGAAHDDSVAVFIGGSGNDRYSLGTLGYGAAHDGGTAVFIDRGGNDRYRHREQPCRAFGASAHSGGGGDSARGHAEAGAEEEPRPANTGLFFDMAGADNYPLNCPGPGNQRRWTPVGQGAGPSQGLDAPTHQKRQHTTPARRR
jgi:hypothetical protein